MTPAREPQCVPGQRRTETMPMMDKTTVPDRAEYVSLSRWRVTVNATPKHLPSMRKFYQAASAASIVAFLVGCSAFQGSSPQQVRLVSNQVPLIAVDGLRFKDLNRSGGLDPYEDWRLPAAVRAQDLVSRMTLEEKAGAMMHANPPTVGASAIPGAGTAWSMDQITQFILTKHITAFLNRLDTDVASMARQYNEVQAVAERDRLGIPVSLSSDPRSQFRYAQGVSVRAGAFTQWPDPAGFAAAGDAELVRKFADSVRQEYLAVGIRTALSPQADLTVNPRWHRVNGTFGTAPHVAEKMVRAYVGGMQNGEQGLGPGSVISVVKHWVGYGATGEEGFDAHNYYGRHLNLSDDTIEQHILPFTGAFAAQVGGVMPSYGQPPSGLTVRGSDRPIEPVGVGFNRQLLTDVLRGRFKFDGVILSDWQITDDCTTVCRDGAPPGHQFNPTDIAMPWGVENLSKPARFAKAVQAGVDQFGGAKEPEIIIDLVKSGQLSETALDAAVKRIMTQKFLLGLFENPYVDAAQAPRIVGNAAFKAMAMDAQRRSVVLIKNSGHMLPLQASRGSRVYLYRVDADSVRKKGFQVVEKPEEADFAIVAMSTPYEVLHPNYFFGSRYREGSTGFADGDAAFEEFKRVSARLPTIVSFYLERPADLSRVADHAAAIVGNFGVGSEALLDVLTGVYAPSARLPFDLPWTPDPGPLERDAIAYRYGQGLRY